MLLGKTTILRGRKTLLTSHVKPSHIVFGRVSAKN